MVQALLLERVAQRLDDVFLPNQAGETARAPLAGQYLVAHVSILPGGMREKMASLTPALAGSSCGCFLPDLTRFTRLQCGGARRCHYARGAGGQSGIRTHGT